MARKLANRLRSSMQAPDKPRTGAGLINVIDFCARFLPFALSLAWRVVIAVAWGIELTRDDEREMFATICGHGEPGRTGFGEVFVIAGRRSGKSAVIACIGCYIAVIEGPEHMKHLAPGQKGYIFIVSRSVRQALETFRYARNIITRNAELADLLDGEPLESLDGGELRFKNGVVICVIAASKASTRGFTVVSAVFDELAWFSVDEGSANSDGEILTAVKYAMLAPADAPRRRLIAISSPAAKSGVVYQTYIDHYGKSDAPIFVAHGATWTFNPTIDMGSLEVDRRRNPKSFQREILAEFQDSISSWCDADVINAAANGRSATPIPPRTGVRYLAGCDIALKRDSSALVIGHREPAPQDSDDKTPMFVADGVWRWTPQPGSPLDARQVVREMARISRNYGVFRILGDQFAAIPLAAMFKEEQLNLVEETATSRSKLTHFTHLRELLYAGRCSLPAADVLLRELRELQERVTGGSNVQIGHPNRATAHDDTASALAWTVAQIDQEPPASYGTAVFRGPAFTFGETERATDDDEGLLAGGTVIWDATRGTVF